ncbi:hypothetical protein [Chitinophaga sp. YR627]|uniref:hypothetical protein n=1 Tax=Chitinophaga sp. YR627 TaxID=1881041 RepID=UPI000B7E5C95|nr:hypothetical protein [Chitinophaga sp. YR627]
MKKLLKRLLLAVSVAALLFVPYLDTQSCGPELPDEAYRFALFQPDLSGKNDLAPLYYSIPFVSYFDSDPRKKDYWTNCNEWQQITGKTVSLKDIYTVQYDVSPDDFLYAYKHKQWQQLKDNSFVKWLCQPAQKDVLDYMALAKQIEFSQQGEMDPWNEKAGGVNTDSILHVIRQKTGKATMPFLKDRYAFQLVKMYYYNADSVLRPQLTDYYDAHLKNHKTVVADWALLYYALTQPDKNERTRYLLETFERSESKKGFVFGYLSRQELKDLAATRPGPHISALISLMQGLKQTGRALDNLKQLYELEPDNEFLPMLVCREVNKLEDWIYSPTVLGFNPQISLNTFYAEQEAAHQNDPERDNKPDTSYVYYANRNLLSDREYLRTLRDFLISIQQKKTPHRDMLRLAIAHLYNMDGQYATAATYTTGIKNLKDNTFRRQAIVEDLLSSFYSKDLNSGQVKQYLYEQFQALEKVGTIMRGEQLTYANEDWGQNRDLRSALYLLLGQRYRALGDHLTAGLLLQQAKTEINEYTGYIGDTARVSYSRIAYFDKYATPADLDKVIALKHKANKTPFEKMISPSIWAPDDFYRDAKATLQIRQHQFKEAAATLNKIADDFWEANYEYSTYLTRTYIGSPGSLMPNEPTQKRYPLASKKAIVKDIVLLEDSLAKATDNSAKARFYYALGNAYFNISYHGRCWMLSSYGKSGNEPNSQEDSDYQWAYFSFYPNKAIFKSDYYRCNHAMEMYEKARQFSGIQKELHAKVLLMMTVCDQARYGFFIEETRYGSTNGISNYKKEVLPYSYPYLAVLKERYADTETFADARTFCPDVEEYLKH